MRHFLLQHWQDVLRFGDRHGVNPWVFGVLYLSHHPLFWGTMAWLAARVRQKRPVAGVVALGVFFWFMPYAYIFVFGRGLPGWSYALAAILAALGGARAIQEIRRRLFSA